MYGHTWLAERRCRAEAFVAVKRKWNETISI